MDIAGVSGPTGVVTFIKRTTATTRWLAAAMLLAAVGTGCSSSSGNKTSPASSAPAYGGSASASPSPSASAGAATVSLGDTELGKILVGAGGRTLYLFEADKSSTSTCSGTCAAAWPPLVTTGAAPQEGQGVKADLLGTSKRSDGTTMVTYNGHPLYYYAGDSKAGDTTGEELNQFGAEWYVLNASGDKVEGD
jgi:predicted lipoprotein with Yx(FWY)xxD motif